MMRGFSLYLGTETCELFNIHYNISKVFLHLKLIYSTSEAFYQKDIFFPLEGQCVDRGVLEYMSVLLSVLWLKLWLPTGIVCDH